MPCEANAFMAAGGTAELAISSSTSTSRPDASYSKSRVFDFLREALERSAVRLLLLRGFLHRLRQIFQLNLGFLSNKACRQRREGQNDDLGMRGASVPFFGQNV